MIAVDATCPINWQHPLNRGLAAWWLAGVQGRTGGAKWYDLVRQHQGTLTNMDPKTDWVVTSRPGGFGALDFDGSDKVIASDFLSGGSVLSVSCWAKFTTGAIATRICIAHYSHSTPMRAWYLGFNSSHQLEVVLSPNGEYAGVAKQYRSDEALNTGTWRHIAFTFDSNTLKLFIDGNEITPAVVLENTVNSIFDSPVPVTLGFQNTAGSPSGFFTGQLDDARIWLRELSPREVRAYYDLSRQGYPGLLNRADRIIGYVPAAPPTGRVHINLSGNLQSLVGGMQN